MLQGSRKIIDLRRVFRLRVQRQIIFAILFRAAFLPWRFASPSPGLAEPSSSSISVGGFKVQVQHFR
jgi:hypothetical protein